MRVYNEVRLGRIVVMPLSNKNRASNNRPRGDRCATAEYNWNEEKRETKWRTMGRG